MLTNSVASHVGPVSVYLFLKSKDSPIQPGPLKIAIAMTIECPNGQPSQWEFLPSVAVSVFWIIIFDLLTLGHVIRMIRGKQWFMGVFIGGGLSKSHQRPVHAPKASIISSNTDSSQQWKSQDSWSDLWPITTHATTTWRSCKRFYSSWRLLSSLQRST